MALKKYKVCNVPCCAFCQHTGQWGSSGVTVQCLGTVDWPIRTINRRTDNTEQSYVRPVGRRLLLFEWRQSFVPSLAKYHSGVVAEKLEPKLLLSKNMLHGTSQISTLEHKSKLSSIVKCKNVLRRTSLLVYQHFKTSKFPDLLSPKRQFRIQKKIKWLWSHDRKSQPMKLFKLFSFIDWLAQAFSY